MSSRRPALVFIFITLALDILGIGVIVPIVPQLIKNFEGGDVSAAAWAVGWLGSLYALMQFLFAPMLGSLSDRYGRRPVILLSLLGSGLDYFLLAFAPNLAWLVVGRLIAGLTGANFAAATAYIADITPPEKRAASFGLIGAAFGLGFIIGPALGGWLGTYSLRLPFYAAGALTLLNWLYGLVVLPESLAPENRRAFSWQRSNPIGALLALRAHPMLIGLTATYFLIYLAHQVFPHTWVLYTTYRYGWGTKETGFSLALVGLTAAAVQGGLTRVVVRRLGESYTALFGLGFSALIYIFYGLATAGWMIYVIIFIGAISGVGGPALQAIISQSSDANEQGSVQGALASLTSLAGIVGPPIVTGLFGHFIAPGVTPHLPGAAFFFAAIVAIVGALLAIESLRKNHRLSRE